MSTHNTPRFISLVAAVTATLIGAAPAMAVPQSSVVNVPAYPASSTHHQDMHARGPVVPSGTMIRARLETGINSHRTAPGTRFTARIETPVRDSRGNIAIPAGSQLVGTVRGADQHMFSQAHIGLSIDGARVGSRFVPFAANIVRSDPDGFRGGIRMRNYVRLDAGSPIFVRTQGAVPVTAIREGWQNVPMGGGPKHR